MAEFKKKDKYVFWHSPLILLILLGLLFFLVYRVINLIKKERETAINKELILDKIGELKEREDILNKEILKMQTEEGVEETIREKYMVVKQGEKMVVIVDKNDDISLQTEKNIDRSFISWLRSLFVNN